MAFGKKAFAIFQWKRGLMIDFNRTFRTESGQRALNHLCATFHINQTHLVQGEPETTAYNEGQRSVVLYILEVLNMRVQDLEIEPAPTFTDEEE